MDLDILTKGRQGLKTGARIGLCSEIDRRLAPCMVSGKEMPQSFFFMKDEPV